MDSSFVWILLFLIRLSYLILFYYIVVFGYFEKLPIASVSNHLFWKVSTTPVSRSGCFLPDAISRQWTIFLLIGSSFPTLVWCCRCCRGSSIIFMATRQNASVGGGCPSVRNPSLLLPSGRVDPSWRRRQCGRSIATGTQNTGRKSAAGHSPAEVPRWGPSKT